MSLHDAAVLSGQKPVVPPGSILATKLRCLDYAMGLNPKDAGDLIKKAAGVYNWLTRDEKPNE